MDNMLKDFEVDLGDRRTQIIIAAAILGGGYLLMRPKAGPVSEPVQATMIPVDGIGTRSDATGPGVIGWVGNNPVSGGGTGVTTPTPEPEPEEQTGKMQLSVNTAIIDAGKSVTVRATDINMNERVNIYFDNTTGEPVAMLTGNVMGSGSTTVKIPENRTGTTYIVALNQRSGDVASVSVDVQRKATAEPQPTTPQPTTPKPTTPKPTTPKPTTPKPVPLATITANPLTVKPGQAIAVSLSGFQPGELVTVKPQHWPGSVNVRIGTSGKASTSVKVPDNAANGKTSITANGGTSKRNNAVTLTVSGAAAGGKSKHGRTLVDNPNSKPYSCPAGSVMVQEPGSNNHVCERVDNGKLFRVTQKAAAGDASVRVLGAPPLQSWAPEPVLMRNHEAIGKGESIRDMARRVYGHEAGAELIRILNPDLDTDTIKPGMSLRVK